MNKYVVGIYSCFEGELNLVKVEANNEADAIRLGIGDQDDEEVAGMDADDLREFYYNCDMSVEVMQI